MTHSQPALMYVLRAPITDGATQLHCHRYAAEALVPHREPGRAANELRARAKTGNKKRLGNTLILSSDLQSDSLLCFFAAGSRPIRFLCAGSRSFSTE